MASTPPRTNLVHRLPKAALLALAIALVGGGAIGFAAATGEETTTFSIPAPMGGDKAVYDIEPSDAEWDRQARIEVRAPEPLMLPDGTWISAALMRAGVDHAFFSFGFGGQEMNFSMVGWRGAYVDTATGNVAATVTGGGGASYGSASATTLPVNALGGETRSELTSTLDVVFEPGSVPCAVRSSLQERAVEAGGSVTVSDCGWPDDCTEMFGCEEASGNDRFRVVGLRQMDGQDALLLESKALAMRLWYQAGVPYPVRFEFGVGSDEPTSWQMTGFTRGMAPLVPGPIPPAQTPAPILQATADRHGPALGTFRHPFPVSAAMDYAIANSQQAEDFVTAHPSWFVRSATYDEAEQDGAVTGNWWLRVRGDAEEIVVLVNTPSGGPTQLPATVAKPIGVVQRQAGLAGPNNGVWVMEDTMPEPAWPASCRPPTLPTIGSLAQRWAQMERGQPGDANAYGFQLWCKDAVSTFQVVAGDARVIQPPSSNRGPLDPPQSTNTSQVLRMLAVDAEGGLVLQTSEAAVSRNTWGAFQPPADQTTGAKIERAHAAVWSTPGAPAAASITIVSLLAGMLYWFWPAVKAGPLGLFSRLQAPDLLDHPMRKELLQRIEAQPGVHYQDLVRAMGKGKGAIEHHLRKLQDGGLVKSVAAGGYTCFFPVAFDRRLTAAAPALKSAGARKVLAAIRARPGASAMQVAAATGLSPAAINHHLQRLGAAGLVDVLRNGRSLSLQPTALAAQVAANEAAAGA